MLLETADDLATREGSPPTEISFFDREKVWNLTAAQFGSACLRPPEDFDDESYYLPDLNDAQAIFDGRDWLLSADLHYWTQAFDCDDFAYAMKTAFSVHQCQARSEGVPTAYAGMAAGVLWCSLDSSISRHVVNFVLTPTGVQLFDATTGHGCPASHIEALSAYHVVI